MSVGDKAPVIRDLHVVKGNPVTIGGDAEPKQVLVVEFWATWCPPCRQSVPHLTELQRKYRDKNVTIIGVSTEKDVKRVEQFVNQMGTSMNYTVAVDMSGTAEQELYLKSSAGGIPYAFIIDTNNTIVWAGHPMEPDFEPALSQAASQAAPPQQALGPVTSSEEELRALPVKALKALLAERGVAHADCVEKGDLVRRIQERCSNVTYYK